MTTPFIVTLTQFELPCLLNSLISIFNIELCMIRAKLRHKMNFSFAMECQKYLRIFDLLLFTGHIHL